MTNLLNVRLVPPSRSIELIGYACGRGARDQGCQAGPAVLAQALRTGHVPFSWSWRRMVGAHGACALDAVAVACQALAQEVAECDPPFAVIGGDHSSAIGTWTGAARAAAGPIGLIWIDAHMDFHTPETSPSGALHGMPLACLMGYGPRALTGLSGLRPALSPRNVAVIGVRSCEPEEMELAERVGLRIFTMAEIQRRGLGAVGAEALAIATDGTAGHGVSIDLDAFDPSDAPGVGSPEPGGLPRSGTLGLLARIGAAPGFRGIEIAEFNPARDREDATAGLVLDLLAAVLTTETNDDQPG